MATTNYGSLPFKEQIAFFRRKINLPSDDWTQLYQQGHDMGFVVAGANRDDLVADFRKAVDKVISDGTTLRDFQNDFDAIVKKHGWSYKGTRGWRSKVIYDTNLRTSYAAGRYAQMQAVKKDRPYWEFHHNVVDHPRHQHVAWSGMVLHADDPWWDDHYPPLGWGCQCTVFTHSEHDLKRLNKRVQQAPETHYEEKVIGKQGGHPRHVRVPEGVDPGFGYVKGKTAYQDLRAAEALEKGAMQTGRRTQLIDRDWQSYDRPKTIPLHRFDGHLLEKATTRDALKRNIIQLLGSDTRQYQPGGVPVTLSAKALADHLKLAKSTYLPLLFDTLTDPWETWVQLEKNAKGYYETMVKVVKAYDIGEAGQDKHLTVVADASHGYVRVFSYTPASHERETRRQRTGILLQGKKTGR